jgi:hypothetical protein
MRNRQRSSIRRIRTGIWIRLHLRRWPRAGGRLPCQCPLAYVILHQRLIRGQVLRRETLTGLHVPPNPFCAVFLTQTTTGCLLSRWRAICTPSVTVRWGSRAETPCTKVMPRAQCAVVVTCSSELTPPCRLHTRAFDPWRPPLRTGTVASALVVGVRLLMCDTKQPYGMGPAFCWARNDSHPKAIAILGTSSNG